MRREREQKQDNVHISDTVLHPPDSLPRQIVSIYQLFCSSFLYSTLVKGDYIRQKERKDCFVDRIRKIQGIF